MNNFLNKIRAYFGFPRKWHYLEDIPTNVTVTDYLGDRTWFDNEQGFWMVKYWGHNLTADNLFGPFKERVS